MYTLNVVLESLGYQGGTIHQAKHEFSNSPMKVKDEICGNIMRNLNDIEDLHTAQWFLNNRLSHLRGNAG